MNELVRLLGETKQFSDLDVRQCMQLAEQGRQKILSAGDILCRQGETGDCAYFIVSGALSIHADFDANSPVVRQLEAGSLVGEIALFSDAPRNATLKAQTKCELLELDKAILIELARHSPGFANQIIAQLGEHLGALNNNISALTTAAQALCDGDYAPDLLQSLHKAEGRFNHLAGLFKSLADEIVEKRQRTQEMQTAIEIQTSFLPKPFIARHQPHIDIAAHMIPARHVGGDFYDYFDVGENKLALLVGDVSGKGVPAAMFMSMCVTILRTLLQEDQAPGEILARMNDIVAKDNDEAMFVTLFLATLDRSSKILTYANAGHDDVFLKSDVSDVQQLGANGPAIGLMPDVSFHTETINLGTKAQLLLTTDGISEAFDADKTAYGTAQLINIFQNQKFGPSSVCLDAILQDVARHVGDEPASDDITALLLHYQAG